MMASCLFRPCRYFSSRSLRSSMRLGFVELRQKCFLGSCGRISRAKRVASCREAGQAAPMPATGVPTHLGVQFLELLVTPLRLPGLAADAHVDDVHLEIVSSAEASGSTRAYGEWHEAGVHLHLCTRYPEVQGALGPIARPRGGAPVVGRRGLSRLATRRLGLHGRRPARPAL